MGKPPMSNFTVTAATKPNVKAKSIFFKVTMPDTNQTMDVVAFFKDIDKMPDFKSTLASLQIGDTFSFAGRQKVNSYTGKDELVIEGPLRNEMTVEQALSTPEPNLPPVEERRQEVKKYTFPDGNFFWSDGIEAWRGNGRKAKLTYDFINAYNTRVSTDKWLNPDWYALEHIKRALDSEKLLNELAVY